MFYYRLKSSLILLCLSLLSLTVFSACQPTNHWKNSSDLWISDELSKPLHFIAFGDNGSGSAAQMELAKAMISQYKEHPYPLALMLGDNIYDNGDVARYGKSRFTVPYGPLLKQGVHFMPVLGNHDFWFAHPTEEMHFFHMPGPYYDYKVGDVHFYALETDDFNDEQQQWLKKELARDHSPWKIVYGHHPVFSSGEHGSTSYLDEDLRPILEKYHVNLYLCGHDHDYERFKPLNGVLYIVSGGGGARTRPFGKIAAGSLVRLKIHEFLYITIDKDKLTVDSIGFKDKLLDSITVNQKGIPVSSLSIKH